MSMKTTSKEARMKFKDHDIFIELEFKDSDGHVYAKIHESEIDGETFVLTTDGKETRQNVLAEANRIMEFLNGGLDE